MPRAAEHDFPPAPDAPAPGRVRWTRAQADAIRNAGVLTGRYELIDGEIFSKRGQNPPHTYVVGLLMAWLVRLFGAEFVRIQIAVDVSASSPDYDAPEPDAAVTTRPSVAYAAAHPGPGDLSLVAEASDSTARFGRTKKALVFARAGIADYWVVDLPARQVVVHRRPTPGGYAEVTAYAPGERVAPLARPGDEIAVAALLPPPDPNARIAKVARVE